jgi:Antibiotic biosynthesis monooxygenase
LFPSSVATSLCDIASDVLRDQGSANKFWFYEVYESPAAVDFHKTQPHYQAWADFKESGGTLSSVSHKADGEFVGGK